MLLYKSLVLSALGILFSMIGFGAEQIEAKEQPGYEMGHIQYKWRDADRKRPVWTDVWYPAKDGSAARNVELSARGVPFPVVVMSHGSGGSGQNYSWIAQYLARNGFVVLCVSHYKESYIYGPETVDPAAFAQNWLRPVDCTFALDKILIHEDFKERVDISRISVLGHSAGGATAILLGGAVFDPAALYSYCMSKDAKDDLGCRYGKDLEKLPPTLSEAIASYRDPRVKAIVVMDPATGPGYAKTSLSKVSIPVLVIGSENNDFLPFKHHADRFAALIPDASLIKLSSGEGHFIYLDSCRHEIKVHGVPLCIDREGVDRETVHHNLAPKILNFLRVSLLPD